jgi:outer membrane protein assembly factor BamA
MPSPSYRQGVFAFLLTTAALFLCHGVAGRSAQTAVSGLKIGAIRVNGAKRYSADQVIAATGLQPGQAFDQKMLDDVAERLGKSGAFVGVGYSYKSQGSLISIDFKIEESEKFHECIFDNFVWLTPAEIQARLKKDVPLYIGVAPETGNMLDDIANSLEKLSQEKGVAAHVRRVQQANIFARGGDPNWKHFYSAEGIKVTIESFRFTGTSAVKPSDLQHEAEQSIGREYSLFRCTLFGSATILPYYRGRGYLRAGLAPPVPEILKRSSDSAEFAVAVMYAVDEGSSYTWKGAEWNGNQAMTIAALDALIALKPNEVANGEKIQVGWDAVTRTYSKNGYFDAKIIPEATFDETQHFVSYRVTVSEGPQYHMGDLLVVGVSSAAADRLKKRWRLKPGDIFDSTYAQEFLSKEAAAALQGAAPPGARVGIRTARDPAQHLVNVTIQVE